ncbi:hypothetical protein Nepgr_000246 [Nepenthes gracilis]|uniref:Uncharacterized protein n=1 Tax=Nepenthes gracilis TaxID=150966 RepID=A0AAD3P3J9_NEPGR|nr:hypothetical protein Nepgr_000246 [Nepenthes gracilis]
MPSVTAKLLPKTKPNSVPLSPSPLRAWAIAIHRATMESSEGKLGDKLEDVPEPQRSDLASLSLQRGFVTKLIVCFVDLQTSHSLFPPPPILRNSDC